MTKQISKKRQRLFALLLAVAMMFSVIADSRGLSLSDGAIQKLNALFEAARVKPDFGNGRYVRNIIEKAHMTQAERLVENYNEQLTDKEICTLTAEDIDIPENLNTSKVLKIGFAS